MDPAFRDVLLDCALVFASVLAAPLLCERIKLAAIVPLVLAGAALGPGGLRVLAGGGAMEAMGTAGLAYAAFMAGMETDAGLLRKNRGPGLALGLMDVILPLVLGIGLGLLAIGLKLPGAVLLGGLFVSQGPSGSLAVSKLTLARNQAVGASTRAAALAKLCAIAVLLLAPALMPGMVLIDWLRQAGAALILGLLAFSLLPHASAFALRRMRPDGSVEFAFSLALLFALAALAALAGVHPAAAAFAAGLALNSLIPEKSQLMDKLSFAGNSVFLPFFFLWAGSHADLRALADPLAAIIVFSLAVLTALIGKGLPVLVLRWRPGYSSAESALAFGLTAGQSGLGLVFALSALRAGLIPVPAFTGLCAFILAFAAAGPAVARSASRRLAGADSGAGAAEGEGERGERLMAMVSNPEHSQTLVDLALLVSPREGGEPVYAVNVVQESAEAPSALAEAERLLGKIVLRGVAGGDNLIPVARVSYNVAEGVAQTAAELRASAIVAGAGPGSQWMRRPYGQVIDQVVGSTRQLFMVLRSERPLGLHSQVVAVVPPLSERQPGFPRAAAAVKSLARGIKARLSLVSLEHDLPSVSAEWERVRPAIAFQKAGAATWKDVLTALKRYPPASTIFALLNVRQGSLAWQPAVDKLPMAFLEDVPDASLLCVYLPEEEGRPEPEQAITEEAGPAGLLDQARDEGRLLIWGRPMAIADAVRALITLEYPEDRQAQARLSAVFMDIAQREPVELKPGIVLLHAHVPEAAEPVLLWGLSAQGIPNLALKDKMRVLIVLLAPEGQPPEEHLKTLSRLAKEVMAEDFWKRLEAAGGGRPGS